MSSDLVVWNYFHGIIHFFHLLFNLVYVFNVSFFIHFYLIIMKTFTLIFCRFMLFNSIYYLYFIEVYYLFYCLITSGIILFIIFLFSSYILKYTGNRSVLSMVTTY